MPAIAGNRLLFQNGHLLAVQIGNQVSFLRDVPAEDEWQTRTALIQRQLPPFLRGYLR